MIENYEDKLYFVEEELYEYYKCRNSFRQEKNLTSEVLLRNAMESLYFSLKGYTVLGYITQYQFEEIVECLEDEVNGE